MCDDDHVSVGELPGSAIMRLSRQCTNLVMHECNEKVIACKRSYARIARVKQSVLSVVVIKILMKANKNYVA